MFIITGVVDTVSENMKLFILRFSFYNINFPFTKHKKTAFKVVFCAVLTIKVILC